ncbi:hypothetical protein BSFA1_85710 (plasmid) [Burkholderia sp. SFA1]|nr:hypothetical protein BSFA1_85710 [Burkholderia sp. SFA1]
MLKRTKACFLIVMNVIITSYETTDHRDGDIRRFHFLVEDGGDKPRTAVVTLGTAGVFARELAHHTAFDAMMRAIVAAAPDEYDALVGTCFDDR